MNEHALRIWISVSLNDSCGDSRCHPNFPVLSDLFVPRFCTSLATINMRQDKLPEGEVGFLAKMHKDIERGREGHSMPWHGTRYPM